MKQITQHSNKVVDMERPMQIEIIRATPFIKKLISIILYNKIFVSLSFVMMISFKRLFRTERMKGRVLTFLMALSLFLLVMALSSIQ